MALAHFLLGAAFVIGVMATITRTMLRYNLEKEVTQATKTLGTCLENNAKEEMKLALTCPTGFTFERDYCYKFMLSCAGFTFERDYCYKFMAGSETWKEANATCARMDSDLVIPKNEEDRMYLMSLFKLYPPQHIEHFTESWLRETMFKPNSVAVGFVFNTRRHVWLTIRGITLADNKFPSDWLPGNLSAAIWFYTPPVYGYMRRDGIFHNYNKFYVTPFICQKEARDDE